MPPKTARKPARWSSRRSKDQGGFTVLEMALVTGLLAVVMSAAFGALVSFQNAFARDSARVNAVNQAHLAIEAMATTLRSANSISIATISGVSTNYAVTAYVQAGGNYECQAWKITGQSLYTRTWSVSYPDDDSTPSSWTIVATDIDNASQGVAPFSLSSASTAPYDGRLLGITIYIQSTGVEGSVPSLGSDVLIKDSVTGRDIEYATGGSECTTVP